jgi:GLPGLI family protein
MGRKTKQIKTLIKIFLLTSICAFAQHKTVEVDYIVKQTILKSVALEYDGNLKFNDSSSVYFFDRDSRRVPNAEEELGDFVALGPSLYSNFKDYTIYKNGNNFLKFTKQINKKNYVVQDTFPKLAWNITSEERIIEGFNCSKATVEFRGRKYIAWFTTALPYSFGPWKFNGLPGVILEVYDTELLFTWQAKKIKSKVVEISIPKIDYKIISLKESEKLFANSQEKRLQEMQARSPEGKVSYVNTDSSKETKFEWEEKQSK